MSDFLSPPAALELDCGGVELAGRRVLEPLRLCLSEQRIAVIGCNGSGKTTLLRLMAGLIAPLSGQVQAGGDDLLTDRRAALRRVGLLFQNPDHQILFPTVVEELAFGLIQQGERRARADERARAALNARGRGHWADVPVSTLSGGQKQYLCLLSLLLMAPETLLLDEPFASLDWPARLRLKRELAGLPQRLIVITHAPEGLEAFDRLLWLEAGRIRADGPPAAVLPAFHQEMERLACQDADTHLAG